MPVPTLRIRLASCGNPGSERDFEGKRFGDKGYAREELVAKMGEAFLCADLRITREPREDDVAYLSPWLEVLKEDKRVIFNAASHEQKAS